MLILLHMLQSTRGDAGDHEKEQRKQKKHDKGRRSRWGGSSKNTGLLLFFTLPPICSCKKYRTDPAPTRIARAASPAHGQSKKKKSVFLQGKKGAAWERQPRFCRRNKVYFSSSDLIGSCYTYRTTGSFLVLRVRSSLRAGDCRPTAPFRPGATGLASGVCPRRPRPRLWHEALPLSA